MDHLGGCGEAHPGGGLDGLDGASHPPPMRGVDARDGRDALPGKPLERPAQGLLVSLDRQKVVTTPITYPLGGVCLGIHRVGGDHCPVEVEGLEQVR